MKRVSLQADYLVVGCGGMGMAFADALVTHSAASLVMVDSHVAPGGHWNDAYPFVRLHQPSTFYGVNSLPLGNDSIEASGWNRGLYELASGGEVCAYFERVMRQRLLPSGRVQYFPSCDYHADGRFVSRVADLEYQVVARKMVDATYMNVSVPATRPPRYAVANGVHCIAPNTLPSLIGRQWQRYAVIGSGKTGIDTCLFLLEQGIKPDRIVWIMPRDAWLHDRAQWQAGALFEQSLGRTLGEFLAGIGEADSIEDVFARLAARRVLVRIDESRWPTAYRCATVTQTELAALRGITNIVRKGRVQSIDNQRITLAHGNEPTDATTLHIDCSADGAERVAPTPIFTGPQITLQSIRWCQQVFSAALIAFIESRFDGDAEKNALCTPVPHPSSHHDLLRTALLNMGNAGRWGQHQAIRDWLKTARLDQLSRGAASPQQDAAFAASLSAPARAAMQKLTQFVAALDGA